MKLAYEPGEVYAYTSANYLLLGAIIENVTNRPFAEFMRERIFAPLGMNRTAADFAGAEAAGLAPGYRSWFGRPIKGGVSYDHAGAPYGYIVSSTSDMAKFLTFVMQGGKLLDEAFHDLWLSAPADNRSYGFGWHFARPADAPGFLYHGGATPQFRGEMFFLLLVHPDDLSL